MNQLILFIIMLLFEITQNTQECSSTKTMELMEPNC